MRTIEEIRQQNAEYQRQRRARCPGRIREINQRADERRKNCPLRKQQVREASRRQTIKRRTGKPIGRAPVYTPEERRERERVRCRKKNKRFRTEQRERYLEQARRHQAKFRSTVDGCLHGRISCAVWYGVRQNKQGRTWTKLLGFSVTDLKKHLESQFTEGMTWDLLLAGEIEIDHIFPRCALPHSSPNDENFKKLWSLSNLRPLWRGHNRSKISQDRALKKALFAEPGCDPEKDFANPGQVR